MIICKVWDGEYPWDVRAEKVARALTEGGHTVHLVARNRLGRPLVERMPEAIVHRMRPWPIGRRLNAATMFPAPLNPRWYRLIHETARREKADLILVRDLPLALTAVRAARSLGIPCVLDMAEHYPAMLQAFFDNGRQGRFDFLVRNPRMVAWVERRVLERVDHTLVVVEESGDRLQRLGVDPSRITLVSNTPPLDRVTSTPRSDASLDGQLHVVYLGLLEVPRGVGVLLDALALSRGVLPVRLTVVGDGRDASVFKEHARRLALSDREVTFLGRLPHAEALQVVASGDVGAIPHFADESWNNTIPNKLFDYMAFGLPVLTSDAVPAARVVRETRSGEVFRDRDPRDLLRAWRALADPELRKRYGAAGREAVLRKYNWEADTARLYEAIERVTAARR